LGGIAIFGEYRTANILRLKLFELKVVFFVNILSLDVSSTKIGWAVFSGEALVDCGVLLADRKDKNPTSRIEQLYLQLKEVVAKHKLEYVVFENTPGMNANITRMLSRAQGCVLALCFEYDFGIREYMPTEWRSAVGLYDGSKESLKREYQKQKAIERVNETYKLSFEYDPSDISGSDDICEAILIGQSFLTKERSLIYGKKAK
jgi:Holliday junction resolvasome RuvABC endonuclease subunit